jgi:hypothetical protein
MAAVNIYHTGSQGLAAHYDDPARFQAPIAAYQPFSDKTLVFGRASHQATEMLFVVVMPRGSLTVMEPSSFALNGVPHMVRSKDLRGRSGVVVLRGVPDGVFEAASPTLETLHRLTEARQECRHRSHGQQDPRGGVAGRRVPVES